MTHPNFVTNGASLEDCHTNFFALADLCGIKWRRLYTESMAVDPLDDPVLSSFSKCLGAGIPCVWRRYGRGPVRGPQMPPDLPNQLHYNKELWIFWYGEEPDLSGLLCQDLVADPEYGSWESALSYECRTLLFKSLHNLVERCLLSKDLTRLGKWFTFPQDESEKSSKTSQVTFSLNYFVHGESTVCVSLDVRHHPAVYRLSRQNIHAAQGSSSGLKVILSPYGLLGTLTGQTYKESDQSIQRLLGEWQQFYPLPAKDTGKEQDDDKLPCVVEVIIAGVKMRYPSSYVFVVECDETPSKSAGSAQAAGQNLKASQNLLTPPASPLEQQVCGDGTRHHHQYHHHSHHHTGKASGPAESKQNQPTSMVKTDLTLHVKNNVWQDSVVPNPVHPTAENAEDAAGHWNFQDPSCRATCGCCRYKSKTRSSKSASSATPGVTNNPPSATVNGPTTNGVVNKKSEKVEKSAAARATSATPFHKRLPVLDGVLTLECEPAAPLQTNGSGDNASGANCNSASSQLPANGNLPFQYKGAPLPNLRAPTPSGSLPQLQTPLTSHGSVESPHSATPGLMLDGSAQQGGEPAMPTLSPHPPGLTTQEEVKTESQEATVSQSPAPEGIGNVTVKQEKIDQIMSPYQQTPGSNLMSDCKAENSPWPGQASGEESVGALAAAIPSSTNAASTTTATTSVSVSTSSSTTTVTATTTTLQPISQSVHGLKRPSLPVIDREETEEEEDLRNGLLYDYSSLTSQPVEGTSAGRKRLRVGHHFRDPFNHYAQRQDLLQQQMMEGVLLNGDLSSSKPKDPYEFNDEFDEDCPASATSSGFRNRSDVPIKEEDKSGETGIPLTPDPATPNAPSSKETTPKPPNNAASVGSPPTPRNTASSFTREEDLQVTDRDLEQLFETSSDDSSDDMFQPPSTPSSVKMSGTGDELSTSKSTKTSNSSCTAGILGAAELTRMFPTPPSLEHNAVQSPSGPMGSTDITVLESGDGTARDKLDGYISCGSPGVEMDWSYVFKVPVQLKFASSSRYYALTSLPSATLPPLTFPGESVYKASGHQQQAQQQQQHHMQFIHSIPPGALHGNIPAGNMGHFGHHGMQHVMMANGPPQVQHAMQPLNHHGPPPTHMHPAHHQHFHHHMTQQQGNPMQHMAPHHHPHMMQQLHHHPMMHHPQQHHHHPHAMGPMHLGHPQMIMDKHPHPCHPMNMGMEAENRLGGPSYSMVDPMDTRCMNYDLQSPASNASLNKHLHSIDSAGSVSGVPESHSLVTNLVLSDTMMNLFKDHNFASCTICVCNMNIKGADSGLYLPDFLLPGGSDEPQYKCTCGFSAVVNRHYSYRSGLFYEDEVEITGVAYEPPEVMCGTDRSKGCGPNGYGKDEVPQHILDLIKLQCSTLYSACSVFHKAISLHSANAGVRTQYNALEVSDFCEMCFLALETGRQAIDNVSNARLDECLKSSILHKWPFLTAKCPPSNHETVQLLRSLQPLLQEAVQRKRTQTLWEVTYTVSGPLTWRQFHRLAGRGTDDQCEPQPIPSLLVGYEKDWLGVSPFALKFWDKILLEPHPLSRDVAYVVVAPDNEFVLGRVKTFFKELSSIYEVSRLGRHCPINKVLRDGIMRVGKTAARKLADEPIDDWFNSFGGGPVASKIRLYAQVCRHHLAPHLAQQTLDKSLLDGAPLPAQMKPPEKPAASPRPPSTPENQSDKDTNTKPSTESGHNDSQQESSNPAGSTTPNHSSGGSVAGAGGVSGLPTQQSEDSDEEQQAPSLVIYVVEPFSFNNMNPRLYRFATLGLMRCYMHMLQYLPEHILNNIHLQLVTLDSVLSIGNGEEGSHIYGDLKETAFSVFAQSRRSLVHQSNVKSLTGFGPAAAQDIFLKSKSSNGPFRMLCLPYILAPQRDKQTELGEMYGDRREKSSILFCTYCLTSDQRWLLASCTNDKGEILENTCINIEIPNRTRRKKASSCKEGLAKLFDFVLGVLASSVQAWRLVIGRLGRIGHGELREWAILLGRKSLLHYSRRLRELCCQCSYMTPAETPSILSACLISLEPDTALRVMSDQFTPDSHFNSSCHSCDLSTPQDATCTHILVFPTSAMAQSSQATFHQEHMDPLATTLGDDDIMMVLNDGDIAVGNDISDIFKWTESPGNSPRRDSISQQGSPNGMGCGRQSPFQQDGPNRGSGMTGNGQEESVQLLQQPLALGYYVSTAKVGNLPKWFWSACPHSENQLPSFLKSALLFHSPLVQQNSDDILHSNSQSRNYHPLDSNLTTDVLRYVLEGYNALSWLSLDPVTHDRRSCLPVHIQVLMQMYHAIETLT